MPAVHFISIIQTRKSTIRFQKCLKQGFKCSTVDIVDITKVRLKAYKEDFGFTVQNPKRILVWIITTFEDFLTARYDSAHHDFSQAREPSPEPAFLVRI